MPVRKGKGVGALPGGSLLWVLHLEGFKGCERLGEVLGEDLRIFMSVSKRAPSRPWSPTDGSAQGAISPGMATWLCCFSGPGAGIHLKPRCYL